MAIILSIEDFLQGSMALIFITISFIVGIKLLLKYKTHKQTSLLFAGLAWITLVSPWFNTGFNFLVVLITGAPMSDPVYLLIGYMWVPIPLIFWLQLFTTLKYKSKQKIILILTIANTIVYEIIFLYYIFTDFTFIGAKSGLFNDELTLPFVLYVSIILIIAVITGFLFGIESFKSENPEIKLKGKFLIAAWASLFIGALFDAGLGALDPFSIVLVRLLLISSAIEFYCGFFLPNLVKNLFLKAK
jgi:hypothetical protein